MTLLLQQPALKGDCYEQIVAGEILALWISNVLISTLWATILLAKDGHETRKNLDHFMDVVDNPLNPGSIFLFPESVYVSDIRLLHGLPYKRRGVSVSNITVKSISGFSWNFQDKPVMTQGTIWNILGMTDLTPWIQDSLFYFYVRVCWQHHGMMDGWMFMKFLRIWTQGAMGYTFHASINCFMPFKLCAAEVCALGVLLDGNCNTCCYWRQYGTSIRITIQLNYFTLYACIDILRLK